MFIKVHLYTYGKNAKGFVGIFWICSNWSDCGIWFLYLY